MRVPDCICRDVSLARYSTLCIGGRADYFTETIDPALTADAQLVEACEFARDNNLDIFTLGQGSNVLFGDAGFRGLVLHIAANGWISWRDGQLWVDAGSYVSTLVNLGVSSGLTGFESFAGLPGTVGGAVYGNAGCYGAEFWDMVEEVIFFDGVYVQNKTKDPDMFRYRWSLLKDNPQWIILAARLAVRPESKDVVAQKTRKTRQVRSSNQPKTRSAGCIFKNPVLGGERVSAGALIDRVGLKGAQVGRAMISEEHGNFFVNLGGATAADFIKLIALAKGRVLGEYGVLLEEEIVEVGEF